ncbi:MAG: OmpA family protein [Sphingopyxis sp.]|nr:OmpA family protein [Sphingopyxis sp.]
MRVSTRTGVSTLAILLAATAPVAATAQSSTGDANIVVTGVGMAKGPEIKGIISARDDDRLKIVAADGSSTVVTITDATRIRAGGGLFSGKSQRGSEALLNGLPVTVKTLQSAESGLIASQITFRNSDFKTATMIHNGTDQRFARNEAATEALRSRVSDIDKYNIKRTTNVYFDTGKWQLTPQAKSELCATATEASATDNSLMLVLGYTDDVGNEEYNQTLSEKRASSVINYLQQACRWAPYRVLTPAGMAESDPAADNTTAEGRAQNRRVSVNVLVSKAVDVDAPQVAMRDQ